MPEQLSIFDQFDMLAAPEKPSLEAPALPPLEDILDEWVLLGWLRALDAYFTEFLASRDPEAAPCVLLAAALASHQLGRGHICLDLAHALDDPDAVLSLPPQDGRPDPEHPAVAPARLLRSLGLEDAQGWRHFLLKSRLVTEASADPAPTAPLILDGTRLYLQRYWLCECEVAYRLKQRMHAPLPVGDGLRARLDALFTSPSDTVDESRDWQKAACALALRNRLTVISGGPGTGKTTTVTRLLALLQENALGTTGRAMTIRLAAPTGKAAARLTESISAAIERLSVDAAVKQAMPRDATTLHRLLGARPDTRHFRYHADNPLALDLLVVDEASMVDLELMAALLAALPDHARLVLLGDKDQLASVEAGAVLGDLCAGAERGGYGHDVVSFLSHMMADDFSDVHGDGGLLDHIVVLRKSYRFHEQSGIGALARAINQGDVEALKHVWRADYRDIKWHALSDGRDSLLLREALKGYRHYLRAMHEGAEPLEVIDLFARFQVLCALRRGPWGVEGLNQLITDALYRDKLIEATRGWYAGRPVMVTRNDPQLGLYNGDIGITLSDPQAGGRLRVFFEQSDDTSPGVGRRTRAVLPGRLNDVETVFAMTVHKSQGSEFDHVLFVLPDRPNPILTKELVYTGVTRAKTRCDLMSAFDGALGHAVQRHVWRASGIRQRLIGE
ncbi:exodeoxyribonuclease V subunit alpha [Phytohalomonas tamaricis]|uniref:exodeoxyribonuclease V subunit alpha n=1 Tax=Phytohalomonas tamaricis TaxID=2081032 RepID=UPI0021D427CC|nr:exodeoxyribonuclease V subunit alpha [Phytohalomonas tamaricis]